MSKKFIFRTFSAFWNNKKAKILKIFLKIFGYFENISKIFWKYFDVIGLSGLGEALLPFEVPKKVVSSLRYV